MLRVAGFHGVEDFVGFFNQKFAQGLVCLLAIPGAAARASQAGLEGYEFFEPFTGASVASDDRNFWGAICIWLEMGFRMTLFCRTPTSFGPDFGFIGALLFCGWHGGFRSLLCRIQFTGSGWWLQEFGPEGLGSRSV